MELQWITVDYSGIITQEEFKGKAQEESAKFQWFVSDPFIKSKF